MDYSKYTTRARQKITQYGKTCVVKTSGTQEYNADTNEYENTSEQFQGVAIIKSTQETTVANTDIKAGDVSFMACLDKEPKAGDIFVFCNKEYSIIKIMPCSVDGSVIYYDIVARG